jgi:hypothetical protein
LQVDVHYVAAVFSQDRSGAPGDGEARGGCTDEGCADGGSGGLDGAA